jgi:hypothetical protein
VKDGDNSLPMRYHPAALHSTTIIQREISWHAKIVYHEL